MAAMFVRSVFFLLCLMVAGTTANAATKSVPQSEQEITLSFAPLVKKAGPAVVNIFTKTITQQRRSSPLFDDPFFKRFFGDAFQNSRPREQNSLGSGVIVGAEGLIVTNNHVIEKATEIRVVLSDRREFDAKLLVADPRTDLAILKIDPEGDQLPFIEFRDSDELEVGDLVLAIGNPFGVGQTVTSGIVSALARTTLGITDYSFFIQTDAAINPGNSGGALISMDGRLIGVNTAIFTRGQQGGSVGIGFAVPSNMVRTVLDSATGGIVVRPWLGASLQSVTAELAEQFGLDRPTGVIVGDVYPNGPADRAGLRQGDVILAFSGKEVQDAEALDYRVGTAKLGTRSELEMIRKGKSVRALISMEAPLAVPRPDETDLVGNHPMTGARVANLSPAFALERRMDDMRRGVVVTAVKRGGYAANSGLRPGDIVVRINGQEIDQVATLRQVLAKPRPKWKVAVRRGDKVINAEFSE